MLVSNSQLTSRWSRPPRGYLFALRGCLRRLNLVVDLHKKTNTNSVIYDTEIIFVAHASKTE